jgi:peroxiredoxin
MKNFKKLKSMKPLFYVTILLFVFSFKTSYSQQNCWSTEKYPFIDPASLQDSTKVMQVLEDWQKKYDLFYSELIDCPMPKINEVTLKGDTINNKKLMGKVVVINFWSVELSSYNFEIRRLDSMVQYFQDKNVVFIAIAHESKEKVITYLKDNSFKYNMIVEGDKVSESFAIKSLPHTYIFDKKNRFKANFDNIGTILDQQRIEKAITKLLEE